MKVPLFACLSLIVIGTIAVTGCGRGEKPPSAGARLEKAISSDDVLEKAISSDDVKEISRIIGDGYDADRAWGKRMGTPLHYAAYFGSTRALSALLEADKDIDVNVKALDSSMTPLHLVGYSRFHLLAHHNSGGGWMDKALEFNDAARASKIAILLLNGAEVDSRNSAGETPLHLIMAGGEEKSIRELLRNGADVHARDNISFTPLHWAAFYGNMAAITALLQSGAEINAQDREGNTPLHRATNVHTPAVVNSDIFSKKSFSSHSQNTSGFRLYYGWYGRTGLFGPPEKPKDPIRPEAIRVLLEAGGADPNAMDGDGYTPLHRAAWHGRAAAINALLGAGADPNARDAIDGNTPLHMVRSAHRKAMVALVRGGANPELRNNNGDLPSKTSEMLQAAFEEKRVAAETQKRQAAADRERKREEAERKREEAEREHRERIRRIFEDQRRDRAEQRKGLMSAWCIMNPTRCASYQVITP